MAFIGYAADILKMWRFVAFFSFYFGYFFISTVFRTLNQQSWMLTNFMEKGKQHDFITNVMKMTADPDNVKFISPLMCNIGGMKAH